MDGGPARTRKGYFISGEYMYTVYSRLRKRTNKTDTGGAPHSYTRRPIFDVVTKRPFAFSFSVLVSGPTKEPGSSSEDPLAMFLGAFNHVLKKLCFCWP